MLTNAVWWSVGLQRDYGYRQDQIGSDLAWWCERIHPEDRDRVMASVQAALAANRADWSCEYRFQRADGTFAHLMDRGCLLKDQDGTFRRMIGGMEDITERWQAEELRRTQYELALALAASRTLPEGLHLCLASAMQAAELDAGGFYLRDEASGALDFVVHHGLSPDFVRCVLHYEADSDHTRLVMRGEPLYARFDQLGLALPEAELREGLRFLAVVPIKHEGRVMGCLNAASHTFDDIPPARRQALEMIAAQAGHGIARLKAELALRASEEKYRGIFDESVAAIYVFDRQKRFLDTNQAGLDLLGYSREELLRKSILEVDAEPAAVLPAHAELLAGGRLVNYQHRLRRKDGTVITVLNNSRSLTDAAGGVIGMQSTLFDITQRQRAKEEQARLRLQLAQAQKLEAVGRLAGGVAHDFNNMLQANLGNAALALEHLPPASPLHDSLAEIQHCAQHSADLTRQLLAFARKQTVCPKVLDLNETVEAMLKMLRRLIGEHIGVAWLPGANLGLVKADPSQIDQILANLCVNARDAIKGQGQVTIQTENFHADPVFAAKHPEAAVGDYVRLVVSDNGCGMAPEVLAHAFEPFFTTKGIGEGTGLGLATVYGIVKQNEGFILVASEPGHGTTFTVHLLRHGEPTTSPPEVAAVQANQRGHETILVVEDEPTILRVAKKVLESRGYTVLTAVAPGEAIRLAERHTGEFHLLMTDVVMPEMNGRDLARQLLGRYPNLKCLFMSGYTADVLAPHGVLDEGLHFLQKPFTIPALTEKVRQVLAESVGRLEP